MLNMPILFVGLSSMTHPASISYNICSLCVAREAASLRQLHI